MTLNFSYKRLVTLALILLPTSLMLLKIQGFNVSASLFLLGAAIIPFIFSLIKNPSGKIRLPYINLVSIFIFCLLLASFGKFHEINSVINIAELFIFISFFYLIINSITTYKQVEKIIKTLLVVLSLILLFFIYKFIFIFNNSYISLDIESGSKFGKNSLAFFLTIFFSYALFNALSKKKISNYFIVAIIFTGILLTLSRTAWAVTILILVSTFMLYKNKFKLLILVLMFGIPLVVFGGSDLEQRFMSFTLLFDSGSFEGELNSIDVRKDLIDISLGSIKENPLLGIGYGNFSNLTKNITSVDVGVSHNDYLQLFVEGGILSLIIFIILMFSIIIKSINILKEKNNFSWIYYANFLSLVAIFIYMFLINIVHSLYFWVILGIIVGVQELSKEFKDNENHSFLRHDFSKKRR